MLLTGKYIILNLIGFISAWSHCVKGLNIFQIRILNMLPNFFNAEV